MNKTEDIQQMIGLWLGGGPMTVDAIAAEFRRAFVGEQLTWLGIAMHKLEDSGSIRFPACHGGHNHCGGCVAEVTA